MTPADFQPELPPEPVNHKVAAGCLVGDSERGRSVAFHSLKNHGINEKEKIE